MADSNKSHHNVAIKKELDRTMKFKSLDNKTYLQKYVVPTLLQGLSEMYEVRPKSPIGKRIFF